jgi:hypothetical protein
MPDLCEHGAGPDPTECSQKGTNGRPPHLRSGCQMGTNGCGGATCAACPRLRVRLRDGPGRNVTAQHEIGFGQKTGAQQVEAMDPIRPGVDERDLLDDLWRPALSMQAEPPLQ